MKKESAFEKVIDNSGYTQPAIETDAEAFEKVVRSRRSIRVFDGTPVPPEVMQRCLELALLAPNSSNLQPWEFYWVKSAEKKHKLVEACFSQPAAKTAAELIVAVGRTDTWKRGSRQMLELFEASPNPVPQSAKDYYAKLVHLVYRTGPFSVLAPLKFLLTRLVGLFRPMAREPLGQSDMRLWATKSTALACENLMLAFRAYGFDTCPMEGLDSARVRALLALPRSAVVVMAISVGKRKPEAVYGPQIRFDSGQFLFEV